MIVQSCELTGLLLFKGIAFLAKHKIPQHQNTPLFLERKQLGGVDTDGAFSLIWPFRAVVSSVTHNQVLALFHLFMLCKRAS